MSKRNLNAPCANGRPDAPETTRGNAATPKAIEFQLPIRFYVRDSVAWDDENPAKGFKGTTTQAITLTTANTAVACMHPGNYCCPGGIEWGADSPYADWAKTAAHLPRIHKIIEERIAPLFEVVRAAGIRVMYLLEGWESAGRYPQQQQIAARVNEPTVNIPRSPNESWRNEFMKQMFGPEFVSMDQRKIAAVLDVAPAIAPQDCDWVVTTTAQASTLLSEHGIWNILYTGFDGSGCVRVSAGGMVPMGKLGYRCILLRDCTTGGETAESFADETLSRASCSLLEMGAATADSSDLRHSLAGAMASDRNMR